MKSRLRAFPAGRWKNRSRGLAAGEEWLLAGYAAGFAEDLLPHLGGSRATPLPTSADSYQGSGLCIHSAAGNWQFAIE